MALLARGMWHETVELEDHLQTFEQFDFADEKNQGKIRLIIMLDDIRKLNKENILSNEKIEDFLKWKKQFGVLSKELSAKQLLKHLESFDRYRGKLEPFSHLRLEIVNRLIEICKLDKYEDDKKALVDKGQIYSGMFHGKFHGAFTNRDKLEAVRVLKNLLTENCDLETTAQHLSIYGPALKQGTLDKLAKPLVAFFEKKIKQPQPMVTATESSGRRP